MSSSLSRGSFEVRLSVPVPQTLKSPAVKDGRRLRRGLSGVLWCHVLKWRRRWLIFSSNSQTAECACVKQRRTLLRCCARSLKLWRRPLSSKTFSIKLKPCLFGILGSQRLHCIGLGQELTKAGREFKPLISLLVPGLKE